MNHSYRVIWNVVTGTWQAVAETAKGRGKSKSVAQGAAAAALLLAAATAGAGPLPTGGNIVAGSGAISQSGSTMTINQSTAKMAVNWDSFSVGQGNTVNFVQPSTSAVALNRVLGSDVSVIQGAINANGQVFLLNPNGVLFTPTAQVNVGALMASTLKMSTEDFMAGNYKLAGDSSNAVVNQGNITAVGDGSKGGAIALIAAKVINEGNLTANSGNVLLGAGSEVVLDLGGPVKLQVTQGAIDALVQNSGAIQADGGLIYLTAQAVNMLTTATINNTGVIRAQTLATGEKGEIRLMADMVSGTANVGGTLDASAPNGGNGGFIETSANTVHVSDTAQVTTLADHGQTGQWLIDPNNYTIAATGGNQTGAQVATSLNTTNVTIQTSTMGTSGGNGDIFVNDNITKTGASGATTLTLQAERNIDVNANITSTGSALNITLSAANSPTGTLGGVRLEASKILNSNGGNILIGGYGGSVTNARTLSHGIGYALNYSADQEAVSIGTSAQVLSRGGDITINGYSTKPVSGSNDTTGVHIGASAVIDSGYYAPSASTAASGGYINVAGRYVGTGTPGSNSEKVFGVKIDNPSGNSGQTTLSASTTTGAIRIDGSSTYDVAGAYALNMTTNGLAGNIYFNAYSVADLIFILNGGLKGVTFTYQPPNSGCRSGYPNCGLLSVNASANNSYLYATYNAVNMSVLPIYVSATLTGTKVYDGTLTASNLNFSDIAILDPNGSGYSSANVTGASYTTPSANVGSYNNLSQSGALRNYTANNKTYVLGYNFTVSPNYTITPATAFLSALKTYDTNAQFASNKITAYGVNGETLSLSGTGPAIANSSEVAANGLNYLTSMGGLTLANGTGLASNYVLPSLLARSANNIATITPAGLTVLGTSGTKVYDGTATFDYQSLTLSGILSGQDVSLDHVGSATVSSPNVGTYNQWATSTLGLMGTAASNYTLTGGGVTAVITPATATLSAVKTYNGNASFYAGQITASGINGETLTLTGASAATANSSQVADNSTNFLTSMTGLSLANGTGLASNYMLPSLLARSVYNTARIDPLPLNLTILNVSGSKVYDGNPIFYANALSLGGILNSDNVQFDPTGSATVASRNVGTYTQWVTSTLSLQGTAASNYTLVGGSVNAAITPAPLGVFVSGNYNGTYNYTNGLNGTVINTSGLVGPDVGKAVDVATLNSRDANANNYVVGITSTAFDPRNYVIYGGRALGSTGVCADGICSGTNNAGANDGGTNNVSLTVLQPPPAAPIIVPAFPDNGIKAIVNDTRPPEFGGMNYVAAQLEGAAPTTTGQTQGTAPTASATPTQGGAMNYVSVSSRVTDAGQELQVRLPEDKNRKPQSELNVNNTTVSSNTSPLDVFVVDTGINLSNLNNGK